MPYPLSLQEYCKPEFYAVAPLEWETRLREISPILPNLAHLRFRKFVPREDWLYPDRPIWAVYSCTPKHLVVKEMAAEFETHWSEIPLEPEKQFPEGAQMAQRAIVSDYQHFMWHTQGLSVQPFWLLQGEWGGTPAKYTDREKAYLRGSGAVDEPFPIGWFRGCPFDERSVRAIQARDRLLQAGNNFDRLEKENRPEWKKAEDDAAERLYRETVLDSLKELNAPAIAFMQSQTGKSEMESAVVSGLVPPAPAGLTNTLATWKDVYKVTGVMPLVGSASMRKLQPTH